MLPKVMAECQGLRAGARVRSRQLACEAVPSRSGLWHLVLNSASSVTDSPLPPTSAAVPTQPAHPPTGTEWCSRPDTQEPRLVHLHALTWNKYVCWNVT